MVEVVDCLENWTAADRLLVGLDELYSIVFDCSGAGPGMHLLSLIRSAALLSMRISRRYARHHCNNSTLPFSSL